MAAHARTEDRAKVPSAFLTHPPSPCGSGSERTFPLWNGSTASQFSSRIGFRSFRIAVRTGPRMRRSHTRRPFLVRVGDLS